MNEMHQGWNPCLNLKVITFHTHLIHMAWRFILYDVSEPAFWKWPITWGQMWNFEFLVSCGLKKFQVPECFKFQIREGQPALPQRWFLNKNKTHTKNLLHWYLVAGNPVFTWSNTSRGFSASFLSFANKPLGGIKIWKRIRSQYKTKRQTCWAHHRT